MILISSLNTMYIAINNNMPLTTLTMTIIVPAVETVAEVPIVVVLLAVIIAALVVVATRKYIAISNHNTIIFLITIITINCGSTTKQYEY